MLNKQESKKEVMNHLADSEDVNPKAKGNLDGDKTSMDELKAEMGVKKEAINVHSMPGKFVAASQQNTSGSTPGGSGKRMLLIAIGLILLIIAVIAGVVFFVGRSAQVPSVEQPIVQEQNTNQPEDTNTNEDQDINENINEDNNQPEDTNTNEDQDINENINEDTSEDLEDLIVFDSDNDGLSYEEELIFNTNPNLEDTDKDGYKDGQEITSLFNPLLPAKDLASSGLVIKYVNNNYSYSILRPKVWLAQSIADQLNNILILPDSENGESFSILVNNNIDNQNLNEVLSSKKEELGDVADYQNYSLAGESALRSKDNRKVVSIHGDYIYIITHSVNSFSDVNFDSVFEMMLNSFTWLD